MARKLKHLDLHYPTLIDGADGWRLAAEAAMRAERYKEAIEHYKELLKAEHGGDGIAGLAQAYAGRAGQLAAKDMLTEALALWRTRAQLCGTSLVEGPYIGWLIRAGRSEHALGLLADSRDIAPEARAQLEGQLACVALTAPEAALEKLPPDSLLRRHRSIALGALSAYAEGNTASLEAQLGMLPFRSPYRDLRPLLKAMTLMHTDRAQAAALVERIPKHNPFESMAAALRVCVLPDATWLEQYAKLGKSARTLVLIIKGCPPAQWPVVNELAGLPEQPGALHDLLVKHRPNFPRTGAIEMCQRLLVHTPDRLKSFRTAYGALSAVDEARILALGDDYKGKPDNAEPHWRKFVELASGDPAHRLDVPLVLNRLAHNHNHTGTPDDLCDEGIALLERSLEFDATDPSTHLRLIRAMRFRDPTSKQLRQRIERAAALFPQDSEILLQAVRGASESGAHKKAITLAKRILELDPINSKVRGIIGQSSLSQARKNLATKKLDAARRDLVEAQQWLKDSTDLDTIKLLRAITDEDDDLLRATLADFGGGLAGNFQLLLEAARIRRDPRPLIRRARCDIDKPVSAREVVALAGTLSMLSDRDRFLHTAMAPLQDVLARAAKLEFSEPDHLLICEAFRMHKQIHLTRRFAEAALRRWPGRPMFVWLRAVAMYGDNPGAMPNKEIGAVERAAELADSLDDKRAAARLDELLAACFENDDDSYLGGGFPTMPDLGGPARPEAALEALLAIGGEQILIEMMYQRFGKMAIEEMRKRVGGSKKTFARKLIEMYVASDAYLNDQGLSAPEPWPGNKPRRPKSRPPKPGQKELFDE